MTLVLPFDFTDGPTADASQVQANFEALEARVNDLPDDGLVSPTNQVWRRLAAVLNVYAAGASGEAEQSSGLCYFDPADYAVAGKTLRVRLRLSLSSGGNNGVFTARWRLLTTGGALSTVIATAAIDAATNGLGQAAQDVVAPVAGFYGITFEPSGMVAGAAASAAVEMRNV